MRTFLTRYIAGFVGLLTAAALVRGVEYSTLGALAVAALILAIANVSIKPLMVILSLPMQLITLGLFMLIINAAILCLVNVLVPGFEVTGFGVAIIGALVVSVVGGIVNSALRRGL